MNKNTLLIAGAILIFIGLAKPNVGRIIPITPVVSSVVVPSDVNLKKEAEDVISAGSSLSSKEASDLRDLYIGLANLIRLDGTDQVVSSTEHIRQANSIGGKLLHLDLKGKYPTLAKENNDVIIKAIGDDNVALTSELRTKSSDAFMALAWAYNQIAN